jgi:TonB family protein
MASGERPDRKLVAEWVHAALVVEKRARSEAEAEALRRMAEEWRSSRNRQTAGDGLDTSLDDEAQAFEPGVVSAPVRTRTLAPSFTFGASKAGVAGPVNLQAEIWPDGKAHHIQVLRPLPYGLTWRAIAAVRQWRFKPSLKNGKPVKASVTMEVNFRRG